MDDGGQIEMTWISLSGRDNGGMFRDRKHKIKRGITLTFSDYFPTTSQLGPTGLGSSSLMIDQSEYGPVPETLLYEVQAPPVSLPSP